MTALIRAFHRQMKGSGRSVRNYDGDGRKAASCASEAKRDIISTAPDRIFRKSGLIGDIVLTTDKRAAVVSEINASVTSLDQATQKNATMAVETTAACRVLATEAHTLEGIVSRFRLDQVTARRLTKAA